MFISYIYLSNVFKKKMSFVNNCFSMSHRCWGCDLLSHYDHVCPPHPGPAAHPWASYASMCAQSFGERPQDSG